MDSTRNFIIWIILVSCVISGVSTGKVAIDLTSARAIRKVPKEFLSVAIDSSLIRRHWGGIDWRKAIILTSALAPGYLRIGGTNADLLLFGDFRVNETSYNSSNYGYEVTEDVENNGHWPVNSKFTNFTITSNDIDRLHWFSKWINLSVIFDLNVLLRTPGDQWDWRANAQSFFNYAQTQKYNFHFELGNEPDRFGIFNRSVTPDQLAKDYQALRSVIRDHFPYYAKSKIVGPAVANLIKARSDNYFEGFLKHDGAKNVDALTFHHYYFDGRTATGEQFLDPSIMDRLIDTINLGKESIRQYIPSKPDFPLWLGETSSAYGGGKAGLTDSFLATFLWLDKLGLSAVHGLDVVIRQSLFGGDYSLFDDRTDPRPDYWLSVLHKRLVDSTVLKINVITSPESIVNHTRFYAHCGARRTTVFGMNLDSDSMVVSLHSNQAIDSFDVYLLTAENGDLQSQTMRLNDAPLIFDGFKLPTLDGVRKEKPVIMPSYSLAFFVFNQTFPGCA